MSLFTKVAVKVPRRNAFKLSHENHLTANFGELVPTLVQECFPGDKFRIQTEASIKLAPLVFPVMGRIDVYFHTFLFRIVLYMIIGKSSLQVAKLAFFLMAVSRPMLRAIRSLLRRILTSMNFSRVQSL